MVKTVLLWTLSVFLFVTTAWAQSPGNIDASIYKPGDYWKFKITTIAERADAPSPRSDAPEGVITIKYSGNAFTIEGYNYPFDLLSKYVPTILRGGSDMQWLQFPLTVGKKWTYQYVGGQSEAKYSGIWKVDVSAVSEETVNVTAGTFPSVKISGVAAWTTRGFRRTSTYYYSPVTKSVISGQATSIYNTVHTIELVEYGNQ